jgi:hypothetical protein
MNWRSSEQQRQVGAQSSEHNSGQHSRPVVTREGSQGNPDSRMGAKGEDGGNASRVLPDHGAGCKGLHPAPHFSTAGRPSFLSRMTEQDILAIRRHVLTATRWVDVVSISLGVRLYAESEACPEWFRAWVGERCSKHHIPRSLIEALGFPQYNGGRGGRLVAHDQAPGREHLKHEAYSPGTLRMVLDRLTGEPRRAFSGEAEVWDDATVNGVFWVGGDIAAAAAERGDLCAQRYGVVTGRWQLLLGSDVATDYVAGWQWTIRERASYQQTDPLAAWATIWGETQQAPERIVTERSTWESHRVSEVLAVWGIERVTSYHPRTKLVESVFNRLWTRLGTLPASVGRGRGENEVGDKLLGQFRRGSIDPREHCLSLEAFDARLREVVNAFHHDRIESRHYGKWIPAERWAAEASAHRKPLALGGPDGWMTRPERRVLKVRKGGMVSCSVDTGWGWSEPYAWGGENLWQHIGKDVAVYFDPSDASGPATIVDESSRVVLERCAISLAGDAVAGGRLRSVQAAAVRREARVLRPDGTLAAWKSEVRASNGSVSSSGVQRSQTAEVTEQARPSADLPCPTKQRRAQGTITVDGTELSKPSSRMRPSRSEEELDPAELERAEARARERGLMTV